MNNLHHFISSVTGRVLCDTGKFLVGDANGIAVPTEDIPAGLLPDIAFVFNTATPEIKQILPHAQFMEDLSVGIAKVVSNGLFALAVAGEDYANATSIAEAKASALESFNRARDEAIASAKAVTDIEDAAIDITRMETDVVKRVGDAETDVAAAETAAASAGEAATAAEAAADFIALAASLAAATAAVATALGFQQSADKHATDSGIAKERAITAKEGAVSSKNTAITYIDNKTLNEFPNAGDVNINNYRITNLKQSSEGDFDAVSFKFLDDLMNNRLEILWP